MRFSRKGFTLIEIIIYVVIFAVISILVLDIILVMTKSLGSFRLSRNINNAAETAMERMVREIRIAEDVNALSVFETHPGHLVLDVIDPATGLTTTTEFFLSGAVLMFRQGASPSQSLTSSNVDVTNLVFRQVVGSSVSAAVKIELEIQSGGGALSKSEKFYNTAILRKSY